MKRIKAKKQPKRGKLGEIQAAAGVECAILAEPGEGESKLPTFKGNAYTGVPMRPMGWWCDVIIDLAGVKVPDQQRPSLRGHDHGCIVGHTETVIVNPSGSNKGIHVEGVLSGEQDYVDGVLIPARNGFKWQLSVGATPLLTEELKAGKTATVNGIEITGPITISRETEIGEISFVPLGADGNTSVSVTGTRGTMNKLKAHLKSLMTMIQGAGGTPKYTDAQINAMSADELRAALQGLGVVAGEYEDDEEEEEAEDEEEEEASDEDEDAEDEEDTEAGDDDEEEDKPKAKGKAKGKAKAKSGKSSLVISSRKQMGQELRRQTKIQATCKRYGVTLANINGKRINLAAFAIEKGWSPNKTELTCLRQSRPQSTVGVPGGLTYSPMAPEMTEAMFEAALLQATRHEFKLRDNEFYFNAAPDGRGLIRRVPGYLQEETQRDLNARYTDQVQQAAHTRYKGRLTFQQWIQEAFRAAGDGADLNWKGGQEAVKKILARWDRIDRQAIEAEGASNMSISNILANVQNKYALQGYLFQEQAWRRISQIQPVTDFKPLKMINLLGNAMFQALGPTSELRNFQIGDQPFANTAAPYGIIGTIPWTHLVNDDLSILSTIPQKIGQGAGLALNNAFWTVWANMKAGTVNGDDGISFWRTTTAAVPPQGYYNANKATGTNTAIGSAALQQAKALFDNQVDPNGFPLGYDGMQPILLHGPTNWRAVSELLAAPALVYGGGTAALQPNVNVWQGMMEPVMSRYIENPNYVNSSTAWWILFNPAALPVIQTVFLNGVDTPQVLQAAPDYQFDRLGLSIRGVMSFGVQQQNFRGGVYMQGS